jgi:low affinity Fe/Cu permease
MQRLFDAVAQWSSRANGNACTLATAIVFVFAWGVLGPLLHYSDPGQLVVNTMGSIITFLMVFLIQNTQERNTTALQIKTDELIRVGRDANRAVMGIEDLSQQDLDAIKQPK